MMGVKVRIGVLVMLWLAVCAVAQASGVQASLDRDHVTLGDTVTLTLTYPDASSMSVPDLSPLSSDFQVLGASTNVQQVDINNTTQSTYQVVISLRPLHAGTLQIPSLDAHGGKTNALTLHVAAASAASSAKPGAPVFVEATVNTHAPYVGEQVALDIRVYYRVELYASNAPVPDVPGATLKQLGRMQRFRAVREGRDYMVAEWHYALTPGKAGRLDVPPVVFNGKVLMPSSMGNLLNSAQPLSAQSQAMTLTVKPRPAASTAPSWLPARQLELTLDGLPASGHVQVGEPITVTMHEGATGLSAADLPEPSLPQLAGADVYPNKTQDVTRNNGQWITGSRTRSFAIVPSRPGILHVPAITLQWWNVVDDRQETAQIPAHDLAVDAVGGVASASSTAATPVTSAKRMPPAMPATPKTTPAPAPAPVAMSRHAVVSSAPSHVWRWVALGSIAGWLLTLLGVLLWWWRIRDRSRGKASDREASATDAAVRTLRNAFLVAARRGDRSATAQALLNWARVEHPQLRNLGQLQAMLGDADQCHAVMMLEKALYAAGPVEGDPCHDLAAALGKGLAWRTSDAARDQDVLPPLYPR